MSDTKGVVVAYTKAELRRIYANLSRLLPPGARPLTAQEIMEVLADIAKTEAMIVAHSASIERGKLLFSWRIPRENAPTMNEYAHKKGWAKKKLRATLDAAVMALLPEFPGALMNGSKRRRWVRVTRFSTQRVDDLSVDILGGKMPVDSLVRCGLLADDNDAGMYREPRWEKTPRGNTHVLVEVFAIADEQVDAAEPKTKPVAQVVRKPGLMTQALLDGLPALKVTP